MKQLNITQTFSINEILEQDSTELQQYVKNKLIETIVSEVIDYIDQNQIIDIEPNDHNQTTEFTLTASLVLSSKDDLIQMTECIMDEKDKLIKNVPAGTDNTINESFKNIVDCILDRID